MLEDEGLHGTRDFYGDRCLGCLYYEERSADAPRPDYERARTSRCPDLNWVCRSMIYLLTRSLFQYSPSVTCLSHSSRRIASNSTEELIDASIHVRTKYGIYMKYVCLGWDIQRPSSGDTVAISTLTKLPDTNTRCEHTWKKIR